MKSSASESRDGVVAKPDDSNTNCRDNPSHVARGARQIAWWKKLLYSLTAVGLFFVVLEGLLTVCGVRPLTESHDPYVGFDSTLPLFRAQTKAQGRVVLETSPNKRAYFNAQQFSKPKPPGTFRIFCLGGSTTYGRPYEDRTSFPGWLRELLPAVDDRHAWEVINAGGVSYASYRVAAVMQELVEFEPDLFIVYSAHNEFLEDRTYRAVRNTSPLLRRTTSLLARTRTSSLMHSWFQRDRGRDGLYILPGEVDETLNHSVGPTAYQRDDELREQIREHYSLNLQRMIDIAKIAGAQIVLVGPAANVKDCSPFKSQHRGDLADAQKRRWSELYDRAVSLADAGDFEQSLKVFQDTLHIDDRYAELHFRVGHVLFQLRRFPSARDAFDRALLEDVCPLRADAHLRETVRRVAEENQVALVDFETVAVNRCLRSGHNCPGKEIFLDHVHPTIEGNRLLAEAIVDVLIGETIVTGRPAWREEVGETVAQRILAGVDHESHAVALRNLAKVFNWAGKHEEAGRLAVQAVRQRAQHELADDPEALYLAAAFLAEDGQPEASVAFFRRTLRCQPEHADAHYRLADVLAASGDLAAARQHFLQVVKLRPDDANAHHKVGAVLALTEDYQQALKYYRRADELKPNDPRLAFNMALAHEHLGNTGDAIDWYAAALRSNDGDAEAHNRLGVLLLKSGQRDAAGTHFQRALRLRPDFEQARQNLRGLQNTSTTK